MAVWQGVAQPVLVVRCDAGKMQMFVYTASAIQMEAQDENHTVGIRFDGEPEVDRALGGLRPSTTRCSRPTAPHSPTDSPPRRRFEFSYTPHNAHAPSPNSRRAA